MDKRIYIKDWLELKPYEKQVSTDTYYLKVCNEVKKVLDANKISLVIETYLERNTTSLLSCFLSSYFEDLISETNVWNTFIKAHKRLYQKQLPFYCLDEYYEEEINPQDISFLIWYFLNTMQEDLFIQPFEHFIDEVAENIFDIFDKEWDYAPQNKHLQAYYKIDENEEDYYIARSLVDCMLFRTYLFYPDCAIKLQQQEYEVIKNSKNPRNTAAYLNENRDSMLHKSHTRLLSFKGKEWVSELLESNHKLKNEFLNMSEKILGLFFYKGQNNDFVFIEHIASGKKFDLTKKSFDYYTSLTKIDTILFLGIARWRNEWWFSGVYFEQPFSPDIVHEEKNSFESRMAVNFLDHQKYNANEILIEQLAAFKDFNNGSQIAFLPTDSVEKFINGYVNHYNKNREFPKEENQKSKQEQKYDKILGKTDKIKDLMEISENGLVFFNPSSGVEIAIGVNSAFPLPTNPYYKDDESKEHLLRMLMDDSMSVELVQYCIANCKTRLSYFKDEVGKKYLEDIDFLLRFWKANNYHSKPAITYTGQKE